MDILLAEMNIIANHWEHSDQIAESRLNILLTSTSGAAAALILLDQLGVSASNILEVSGIVFLILWMLGVLTFIRMLERNVVAIHSSRSMNRIRKYFAKQQPEIVSYLNLLKEEAPQTGNQAMPSAFRFLGSRTLAAVIGSTSFGMLTNTILLLFRWNAVANISLFFSVLLGIIHLVVLEWYAIARLRKM